MSVVLVKSGSYRNIPVINTQFKLVKGLQSGKTGNWITVENGGLFPNQSSLIRIKVEDQHDFELKVEFTSRKFFQTMSKGSMPQCAICVIMFTFVPP